MSLLSRGKNHSPPHFSPPTSDVAHEGRCPEEQSQLSRIQTEGMVALAVPLGVTYAMELQMMRYGRQWQTRSQLQG